MSPTPDDRRIGIALDGTHIAIAWRDANIRQPRTHAAVARCDDSPSSIDDAIRSLAEGLPVANAATVTLDRPVGHARMIRLPQMSRTTLESLLARDWIRYVISQRITPHVVAARQLGNGRWLAAFAPADMLEAIAASASAQGWYSLVTIASDDALTGAALTLAPEVSRKGECFAIICAATGPTHAVHIQDGVPVLGRRLLADASDADVEIFIESVRANTRSSPTALLFGHTARTAALARALGTHGTPTRSFDLGLEADASGLELLASAGLASAGIVPFVSSRTREMRQHRTRVLTRWLYAAAAAALIAGFGLARYQTRRALSDVQMERADMAGPVRDAMTARASLERATNLTTMIADREANASRSSSLLAAIALALPPSATLTALYVAGESVTVEGESSRSAAVYQALRGIPALEQVKLAAPLRHERQAGDVAVEHFSFSARLRRGGKP